MTVPVAPPRLRRRHVHDVNQPNSTKARLLLALACLWPLVVFFFVPSSPQRQNDEHSATVNQELQTIRNLLDRVDVLGYGATHPRVAVVIVGDDSTEILSSVESVFRHTDLNRLFVVCVVMDGVESDPETVRDLHSIDQGAVPHWHGLRPDVHVAGEKGEDEPHGKKIHVLFSKHRVGLSASRNDAVDFISLLEKKHEEAQLKSPQEDLLLLLLQPGAELVSHSWLGSVTPALIVPPPLMSKEHEEGEDPSVSMKLANAVAFGYEGSDVKATSFDFSFMPLLNDPSAADMALGNGMSFPTPALNGAATAMRLDTYRNLPSHDESLIEEWPVNLDLSLNLWQCADGIDVITDVTVKPSDHRPPSQLSPEEVARFAAAWMDNESQEAAFAVVLETHPDLTRLEWKMMMERSSSSQSFPVGLQKKCRPFSWYAQEVNTDLAFPDEPAEAEQADDEEEEDNGDEAADDNEEKSEEELKMAADQAPGDHHELLPLPDAVHEERQAPRYNSDGKDKDGTDKEGKDKAVGKAPESEKKEYLEHDVSKDHRKLPSKPLDQARLDILSTAKPVDLKYVNVTNGFKDHPHKGARDEKGNWGYVHDETALRKTPPKFEFPALDRACSNRDANHKMLTEKVYVDFDGDKAAEQKGTKRDKIFCLVYTISPAHDRIPYIRETWGPKCDGFMVGSNKTDVSLGTVDIPHEGPEEYNNIWQKVRSMWSYIYDNYYDKYDWFHIGGDDMYILVENFRLYLESEEIKVAANGGTYLPNGDETEQTPLFLGRRFTYWGDTADIFNSGGSGYTLNKASLKALVVNGLPNYFPHAHTFSEDTRIAVILKKLGIFPYETKDEKGEERFLPFMPGHHYNYKPPKDIKKDWYASYSIDLKTGLEACAAKSVAFHYVKNDDQKRLHALLYHLCPEETYKK